MKHVNVSLFVPHLGCPHTCVFCNQRTISGRVSPLTAQDIREACLIANRGEHDPADSEIAFFGGSFTAIEREKMTEYLEAAAPFIGNGFKGIRVSTRPDCIDPEVLEILKRYRVTAIELGSQSMSDRVLAMNGRGHSAEDTVNASRLIKEYGFSLGLQMMTGLYGSDEQTDRMTAERFVEIRPDTVRIYPTVVLEGTGLASLYRAGVYTPPTVEESAELCADLITLFNENKIKVIRVGLHSGGGVDEGFVAGVYHPAFGELCEGVIYRNRLDELLSGMPRGSYRVAVAPGAVSKMTGQKKVNTEYFRRRGYEIKPFECEGLRKYEVRIAKGTNGCI